MKLRTVLTSLVLLGATFALAQTAPYPPAYLDSRPGGKYFAAQYNYTPIGIATYPGGTGSLTFTTKTATVDLGDGRKIQPFSINAYISVDGEVKQPSAVSGCTLGSTVPGICSVTANFSNSHSTSSLVSSGTFGVQEAIIDAAAGGGGVVVIDPRWQAMTGLSYSAATQLLIADLTVYPTVIIEDDRLAATQYWSPVGGTTTMTTPTTLTSSTATDSTTPAGTWAASAYAQGVSCVDIMGQEGPVSATYAHTPGAGSSSVTFVAPTNCVGAIGYKVYSTLAGASYPLAYELPLVTQPATLGNAPVSNGSCTLQTVNPNVIACAVTNATYNETASNATFTAIPVNTYRVAPQTTVVSTTSVYVPNPGGRTTYTYAPSSHIGLPGVVSNFQAFPISASVGSTVPVVMGTITLPPNFMNIVGRTIEICGRYGGTSSGSTTVAAISFQWDANLQNTAGKGVVLGNLALTPATAFVATEWGSFCEDFQTSTASASATGGTIQVVGGYLVTTGVAGAAAGAGATADPIGAGIGSLNLATDARINIVYTHTTGSNAPTLEGLTLKVIN